MHESRSRWTGCAAGAALLLLLLGATSPLPGQSYGYTKEEDPLVKGVKAAIKCARDEDAEALAAAVEVLGPSVREVREGLSVDLAPLIGAAVESGDVRKVAYTLTQLAFQSMRQKLRSNLDESLADAAISRSRLDAAQFYYEELLSPTVRRADKAQEKERHRTILREFRDLRSTLGSPGLFGAGAKDPDPAAFERGAARIEARLREVYTDFLRGEPEEKDAEAETPAVPPTDPESDDAEDGR